MAGQKKKKRPNTGRFLHVLILIVAVLVIFEGKMLVNIFSNHGIKEQISEQMDELFAGLKDSPGTDEKSTESPAKTNTTVQPETEQETVSAK